MSIRIKNIATRISAVRRGISNMSEQNRLLTFTGPAGRTYFDRDGVLQTADENEIREEYDPLTGAYRGMLIESQDRTNYTPNSRNLGGIPGNEDGSTKTGPDGSEVQGYKIAGNNFFEIFEGWDDSDDSLTTSVWVCANKPVTLNIRKPLNSGREEVDCHITTEWQRFSATSFRENGFIGNENKTILDGRHISDDSIVVYAFGFQVESGPVATSYIETDSSPTTMSGEKIEITDSTLFNNYARGTFVLQAEPISFGDARGNYLIATGYSNRFIAQGNKDAEPGFMETFVFSNKSYVGEVKTSPIQPFSYAVSWSENEIIAAMSGDLIVHENKSFPEHESKLLIADGWTGYIKSFDFLSNNLNLVETRILSLEPYRYLSYLNGAMVNIFEFIRTNPDRDKPNNMAYPVLIEGEIY